LPPLERNPEINPVSSILYMHRQKLLCLVGYSLL
jgi:hypothetical protein